METLLKTLLEMFLLIALGFFIRKRQLVSELTVGELSSLLLSVILPLSVLSSGCGERKEGMAGNIAVSFLVVSLFYIGAFILSFIFFSLTVRDRKKRVDSVNMCVFANTSFIGIPLARIMFGSEGVIYAVIYNLLYNIFMFSIGVSLFEGEKKSIIQMLRDMFFNPLSLSSVVAVGLFLSPCTLPSPLQDFLALAGGISTPLSMMIVGAWLVGVDLRKILLRPLSYLVSFMRLIVLPLIFYLALLPFHLDSTLVGTTVLLSAVPVGALNVILAGKYGHDRNFVNETMLLSLILSIITIPMVTSLVAG